MALNTFTPPVAPSPGTDKKFKPKILKADFGDGYTQMAADGLNNVSYTLTLTWESLVPTDASVIMSFLAGQGGYQPFYYRVSDTTSPDRFTCDDWGEKRGQGGIRTVTATFKQYLGTLT